MVRLETKGKGTTISANLNNKGVTRGQWSSTSLDIAGLGLDRSFLVLKKIYHLKTTVL
jgi:hypothetical protein